MWVFPKKLMVYNGSKPLLKWDDFGGFPPIFGNIHLLSWIYYVELLGSDYV